MTESELCSPDDRVGTLFSRIDAIKQWLKKWNLRVGDLLRKKYSTDVWEDRIPILSFLENYAYHMTESELCPPDDRVGTLSFRWQSRNSVLPDRCVKYLLKKINKLLDAHSNIHIDHRQLNAIIMVLDDFSECPIQKYRPVFRRISTLWKTFCNETFNLN